MAKNQINFPIYNFSVGWFNRQGVNPLDFIAPQLAVPAGLGTFKRYPQGYAFSTADTARPLHHAATTIDVGVEDVPVMLEDHSLRVGVDDSEIKNCGNVPGAVDNIVNAKVGTLLSKWRTSAIQQGFDFFRKSVAAVSGAGAWSGAAADPIKELKEQIRAFREMNGVTPNRILFSDEAWDILANNGVVLDLIAYNDAKSLDANLLLKLLGYKRNTDNDTAELPRIMSATVPVGVAKPGAGVPFTGRNLLGAEMWMTYVDDNGEYGNMCGMRQLHGGTDAPVESVESYYVREKHTTFHEIELHRAFAVTAPTCNLRIAVS